MLKKANINMHADKHCTTILVVVHNHLLETQQCIRSIVEFTAEPYEIIVVDNASSDETAIWLSGLKEIKVIKNRENNGFAKAINQGIALASGDEIAILHNDVIVTKNWLNYMKAALYSSAEIGAVGPLSYGAEALQQPATKDEYHNIEELNRYAESISGNAITRWHQTLLLGSFCLLLKRSAVDLIGDFDEQFSPYYHEMSDYAFRMIKKGYRLLVSRETFIHHTGRVTSEELHEKKIDLYQENLLKFKKKWGFLPQYSAGIRYDLLAMLDLEKSDLAILDIGCACGGDLMFIKEKNPNADLYGVELNPQAAEMASCFGVVSNCNIEEKETLRWDTKFDYIIMGDVLEHLYDPLQTLKNLKCFLKPDGCIVASIPNIMHISILAELLQGRWTYQDAGILDKTHLRFFTRNEIEKMCLAAGLQVVKMAYNSIKILPEHNKLKKKLLAMPETIKEHEQFDAYQWIVFAQNKETGERGSRVIRFVEKLLSQGDTLLESKEFLACIKAGDISSDQMYCWVAEEFAEKKVKAIVDLTVFLYKNDLEETALQLIGKAYENDPFNADITYANAFLLFTYGDVAAAKKVINNTVDKSEELKNLLVEIKNYG